MALIKCKECGKEISKKAKTCPHCGHERKQAHAGEAFIGLIMLMFLIWWLLIPSESEVEEKSENTQISATPENSMTTEERIKSLLGEEEYNRQMQEFAANEEATKTIAVFCKEMQESAWPPVSLCGAWDDVDLLIAKKKSNPDPHSLSLSTNFHMLVAFDPSHGDDLSQAKPYCNILSKELAKKFPILHGWTVQIKTPRYPKVAIVTCTIGR
ncbi:MAG: zinc ribbon domain-containing protein [Gammaproteobacteria bacterium]